MPRLISGEKAERALALYRAGTPDLRIAAELGVSRMTLRKWRKREALPTLYSRGNHASLPRAPRQRPKIISGEVEAKAESLYRKGATDRAIAAGLGCCHATVVLWRLERGHTPNVRPWDGGPGRAQMQTPKPRQRAANPTWRNALWARAAGALRRCKLAPDIVEEAVSDIVVAVISGAMPEADIEARANSFANAACGAWASKFGPESLDCERGAEGWRYYDFIPCEEQSESIRFVGLKVLAERLGLDVPAILADESGESMICRRA